jgi:hypothetical protein
MSGQNFGDALALLGTYTSLSDPDLDALQRELELRIELQETPASSHSTRAELWSKILAVDPLSAEAAAERDREARAATARPPPKRRTGGSKKMDAAPLSRWEQCTSAQIRTGECR